MKGFTQRYHLKPLVWFEHFPEVDAAITCENKLKGWLRARKVAVIAEKDPRWMDLSADWFEQVPKVDHGDTFL